MVAEGAEAQVFDELTVTCLYDLLHLRHKFDFYQTFRVREMLNLARRHIVALSVRHLGKNVHLLLPTLEEIVLVTIPSNEFVFNSFDHLQILLLLIDLTTLAPTT